MGVMQNITSSLSGKVESAYLIIKDYRLASQNAGNKGVGALMNKTASALANGVSSLVTDVIGDTDKKFKVQFNPNELEINCASKPIDRADTQLVNGQQQNISDCVLKPTVELTMRLYFDHVNIYDSFMWDKITALTNVNAGASAFLSGTNTYSVQTEVEGLLSALRNQYTRNITFQWAKFSFIGQLTDISAQYTMFSTSGRPVRAKVLVRLSHEMDPELLQTNWYDYYDKAFAGSYTDNDTLGQSVTNLLNIGL